MTEKTEDILGSNGSIYVDHKFQPAESSICCIADNGLPSQS